ncbi:Uncharacterised protein [Legionella sainthelensi]|uniref:Uncharacterized protein n=1 Tax=Legionella sainthelensi TaxID=28087 RepID=A0A0W0YJG1_9GAMM|nr:hypothetical protein [Legionella sainthelensi]AUH71398.1 hypothetical protein CAB17_04455 [Legionella sainthelensi]KTD57066.1 hypothetical protein Lsai_1670 [Legionella sainthelensi]VEB32276.1 Uncharacterised protein [Legionella sainthelensi]VEH26666.1 Uncharacterised protein [Legionella sainthelensi]
MSLETKKSVAHAEIFESEREHLKKKISDCNDQLTKLTNKLIVYRRENNRIQNEFLPYYYRDKPNYHEKIQTCERILETNKTQIQQHEMVLKKLEQSIEEMKTELREGVGKEM